MKIEIKNFGPIDSLTFDLDKDLHFIYGRNAIGKSYATYCLYCLLKNIKNIFSEVPNHSFASDDYFQTLLSKIEDQNESAIDITSAVSETIDGLFSGFFLQKLSNSLKNTFYSINNLHNKHTSFTFSVTLYITDDYTLAISSDQDGWLTATLTHNVFRQVEFKRATEVAPVYMLCLDQKLQFSVPDYEAFRYSLKLYCENLFVHAVGEMSRSIGDIFYLPASRSGLYQALNAFAPIVAQLTQSRFDLQRRSIELPSLSEPISDYFIDLSTVDKTHNNGSFASLIQILEDEILLGTISYDDETRKIMYKPHGIDLELHLSEASSMVAELSPLLIFFRHIINNKHQNSRLKKMQLSEYQNAPDLIFIEEPEAHLHPEVQVKLMQLFAKLSGLRLKVFITSHSNYMFNKLTNLLIKKEISPDNIAVYHLIKGANGTIVNPETLLSEEGITDENFQDVSVQLYNERLDAL